MRFGELEGDVAGAGDDCPPVVLLHGLTFDRGMWAPLRRALPGRRVLTLDLPGHGASPRRGSYDMSEVAEAVHGAITAAGLREPVLVGHSIGAVVATVYAANHPVRAVLDIDQPLLAGPFGELLRSVETVLRGPDHPRVWDKLLAGMGAEELASEARALLRSSPRQDLLLGYWREILEVPAAELREVRTRQLAALHRAGSAFHHLSRMPVNPAYAGWLTSVLPDAGFTVLPGSGHFPHIGQPDAVAGIVVALSEKDDEIV
ncbi:alpha/beta fold hydrolase [Amycolatopsis sp. NPDC058986]|uniref:alpha/beta fold hydrolase n=1 Tax=unclassified Amycolatopsis TaxID=2618356 RepID=UPI0036729BF4